MPAIKSTHSTDYANFGKGRFDVVSGSKMQRIREHAGQTILDVGCGPGAYIRSLRAKGYVVDGVDGNPLFVQQASTPESNIYQIDLNQDLLDPIPDRKYETVMALDVIEHINRPKQLLEAMVRVASKNVLVSVPVRMSDGLAHLGLLHGAYLDPTHLHYFRPIELRTLLQEAGLVDIAICSLMTVPPILSPLFPTSLHKGINLLNRLVQRLIIHEDSWLIMFAVGYKSRK